MVLHTNNLDDERPDKLSRRIVNAAMSLQCKATGLVVILTLSVAAVVSGYLLQSSEKFARQQRDSQMVQMASMLAKAAASPCAEGDISALQDLASESADGTPLIYVVISDARGRQLAVAEHEPAGVLEHLTNDADGRVPVPGQPVRRVGTKTAPVFLDVTYPITNRGLHAADRFGASPAGGTTLLGYVRTGMVENGWQRTMSNRLDVLIGVGILAAVAAIPLGFLLIRRIVSPLDGLATVMHRFSRGDLDVRSPVARRDEIGRLAYAFNRMADQHQRTHERIVRLNEELEKRVSERTQQLRELASREPLTSLYNRRYFNEMLERRFSEARRYESELSCIMIDLDGFKTVNDRFGHQTGDQLLVLTAETISAQLRTADVAARFGGDEFIVLLPQTDAERAYVSGERIAERFAEQARQCLPHVQVSMSMGIASLPSADIDSAEALIRAADHALYEAKAAGKNRIVTTSTAAPPVVI